MQKASSGIIDILHRQTWAPLYSTIILLSVCVCLPGQWSKFQDWSETICSPWHKSLSSGGPSSSLTFIFTFFQVIWAPSSEDPLMGRPIIESHPVIEEILAHLQGNDLSRKRRRLIIGQEWVCLSVYLTLYRCIFLWLPDKKVNKLLKSRKGVKTHTHKKMC